MLGYFSGTITFDDPTVADEHVFGATALKHPAKDGSLATDDTVPMTFVRLLAWRGSGPSALPEP